MRHHGKAKLYMVLLQRRCCTAARREKTASNRHPEEQMEIGVRRAHQQAAVEGGEGRRHAGAGPGVRHCRRQAQPLLRVRRQQPPQQVLAQRRHLRQMATLPLEC